MHAAKGRGGSAMTFATSGRDAAVNLSRTRGADSTIPIGVVADLGSGPLRLCAVAGRVASKASPEGSGAVKAEDHPSAAIMVVG